MTEMANEKKGHMKLTIDLEVNEALMNVMKDVAATVSSKMMKRGGSESKD
ncbi:MAG: hypothetical protein NWE98_09950 [Candidatus Bathyarchaeota archaeon]|nr:hypothetical protein [Candidatus Bathyarchaeota archaeon]